MGTHSEEFPTETAAFRVTDRCNTVPHGNIEVCYDETIASAGVEYPRGMGCR